MTRKQNPFGDLPPDESSKMPGFSWSWVVWVLPLAALMLALWFWVIPAIIGSNEEEPLVYAPAVEQIEEPSAPAEVREFCIEDYGFDAEIIEAKCIVEVPLPLLGEFPADVVSMAQSAISPCLQNEVSTPADWLTLDEDGQYVASIIATNENWPVAAQRLEMAQYPSMSSSPDICSYPMYVGFPGQLTVDECLLVDNKFGDQFNFTVNPTDVAGYGLCMQIEITLELNDQDFGVTSDAIQEASLMFEAITASCRSAGVISNQNGVYTMGWQAPEPGVTVVSIHIPEPTSFETWIDDELSPLLVLADEDQFLVTTDCFKK